MRQSKCIIWILLAGLSLFSCTEGNDLITPPQGGGGEEVSMTIPVTAANMEAIGSKFSTRASGKSLNVVWGNAETRAGEVVKDPEEKELKQVYVVQFSGVEAASTVVKCGTASVNASSVNFSFYPTGTKNRVYMVANLDLSAVNEGTKLSDFENRLETFTACTALPAGRLPMCDYQEFEPTTGVSAPQFNLKAMVAKVVFKCKVDAAAGVNTSPVVTLRQIAGGTTYLAATDPAVAYRPAGVDFSDLAGSNATVVDGYTVYTFYIPENIAGKNAGITKESARSLAKAQPKATYIEVKATRTADNEEVTFVLFLGDPADVTDFNVNRNHIYTVTATILGFDLIDERVTMSNDLSAVGTANCYMVFKPGKYSFNALVMGNGVDLGSTFAPVDPLLTPTALAPASAKMIWCTGTDREAVVKDVKLNGGKITFETGTAEEGNAVIAAYSGADGTGDILWSWHIWRMKSRPADIACLKFDKEGNSVPFTMMEWNLGAYNNEPGDVGSLGLLYQWGRKDPFVNANAKTGATAASTVGDLLYKTAGRNTMDFAIKNPTTFLTHNAAPYDWLSTKNDNLWGNPWVENMTVAGNTVNSSEGAKSIYDPCPPGYRVPPQDTWTRAKNWANNANMGAWNTTNLGFLFTEIAADRSSLWFPGAGYRNFTDGALTNVGAHGNYWSSSIAASGVATAGHLNFIGSTGLNLCHSSNRSVGFSVRCVSGLISEKNRLAMVSILLQAFLFC